MMRKMWFLSVYGALSVGFLSLYGCRLKNEARSLSPGDVPDIVLPSVSVESRNLFSTQVAQATVSAYQRVHPAQLGHVIDSGAIKVIVAGWSYMKPDSSDALNPEQTVIVVDLVEVNTGSDIVSTLSESNMILKDSEGREYSSKATEFLPVYWRMPSSQIVPGEKMRGVVAFAASTSAKNLVLTYEPRSKKEMAFAAEIGSQPTASTLPSPLPGEVVPTAHIGETVTQANISLTVHSFADVITDQIFTPDPGNRFVAVDITIENKSLRPLSVSTLLQMGIRDLDGSAYRFGLVTAEGMVTFPDGEIPPGTKVRGKVPFEVPLNKDLVFVFDDNFIDPHRFFVLLSKGT